MENSLTRRLETKRYAPPQGPSLMSAAVDNGQTGIKRSVEIPCGQIHLRGDLASTLDPQGLVIFAHGSGSSRLSPRNRQVATALNQRGFATLLLDLLTPSEDRDIANRFNIVLLTERLEAALDWAINESDQPSQQIPIGLFGSSTGAAAAIGLAADRPNEVMAVVSRGGRPDLAGPRALVRMDIPTLLIVGGADQQVLALNREAQATMGEKAEIAVVPGATHLFEEPGALDMVIVLAGNWFHRFLARAPQSSGKNHTYQPHDQPI